MAHRTPKINDTVKFTDQQQAILNDAVEQQMEAGGLTALTQAHFNEAMKIVAQRFINAALQRELKHHLTQEDENLNRPRWTPQRAPSGRLLLLSAFQQRGRAVAWPLLTETPKLSLQRS